MQRWLRLMGVVGVILVVSGALWEFRESRTAKAMSPTALAQFRGGVICYITGKLTCGEAPQDCGFVPCYQWGLIYYDCIVGNGNTATKIRVQRPEHDYFGKSPSGSLALTDIGEPEWCNIKTWCSCTEDYIPFCSNTPDWGQIYQGTMYYPQAPTGGTCPPPS